MPVAICAVLPDAPAAAGKSQLKHTSIFGSVSGLCRGKFHDAAPVSTGQTTRDPRNHTAAPEISDNIANIKVPELLPEHSHMLVSAAPPTKPSRNSLQDDNRRACFP
jgi:hypothetical protein